MFNQSVLLNRFQFWVKWLFVLLLIYWLYNQLNGRVGQTDFELIAHNLRNTERLLYIFVAAVLVWVNWGLEALKWQRLMKPAEPLGFFESLRSVLCGVAVSMFTPNRTGEYGGRILTLQQSGSLEAVTLALTGSYGQLLANISLGMVGFGAFCLLFSPVAWYLWLPPMLFLVLVMAVLGWLYSRLHRLPTALQNLKLMQRWLHITTTLQNTPPQTLSVILFWSVMRYCVYVFQFYLLLLAFGVPIGITHGWILVSSIFFVQTFLPTVAIAELGIKGNLALYFIGFAVQMPTAVLTAVLGLWLLNLLLPSVAGVFFIATSGSLRNLFRLSAKTKVLEPVKVNH